MADLYADENFNYDVAERPGLDNQLIRVDFPP
jgi:hypothetical protein